MLRLITSCTFPKQIEKKVNVNVHRNQILKYSYPIKASLQINCQETLVLFFFSFHFLAILNNVTMNVCVQVFEWTYFFHFSQVLSQDIYKWNCWVLSCFYGFPGGSDSEESTGNAGDLGLIPGSRRSPGEGKGYPLQYSGLQKSMDYKSWT